MKSGGALLLLVSLPLLAQVAPTPNQVPPLPEELLRVLATETTLTPERMPAPPPPPPEHALPVAVPMEAAGQPPAQTQPAAAPAPAQVSTPAPVEPVPSLPQMLPVLAPTPVPTPAPVPQVIVSAPAPAPAPAPAAVPAPAVVAPPPEAMPAAAVAGEPAALAAAAVATVDAFHQAMREGWKEGVLPYLAPDVVIYEQGYAESSRDDYAYGNLDSDLVFAASTRREVVRRKSEARGDLAWVVTEARTSGQLAGQTVDLENAETMVLRREQGQWRIVHIHWSAHSRDPG